MSRPPEPKYFKQVKPKWSLWRGSVEKLLAIRGGFSKCPVPSCKWEGYMVQVVPHLTMNHNCYVAKGNVAQFSITVPLRDDIKIQSCFGHYFLLVEKKYEKYKDGMLCFASLQLIGSRDKASQFSYKIEVNSSQSLLQWKARHTPLSILDGLLSNTCNSEGLVFSINIPQLLAEKRYHIKATVSQAQYPYPIDGKKVAWDVPPCNYMCSPNPAFLR